LTSLISQAVDFGADLSLDGLSRDGPRGPSLISLERPTMLPPPEVRDELRVRGFALIAAYLRGDLEALDALVDDDDAGELLVVVTEILINALLKLVSVDELQRQVDAWLDERRSRLAAQKCVGRHTVSCCNP
jgi:hypothetical protein